MIKIHRYLLRQSIAVHGLITLVLTSVVTGIDLLLSAEISTALFYLLPVLYAGWYAGRTAGMITAGIAAACWGLNDALSSPHYSSSWVPVWNTLVRLVIFVSMVGLLVNLRAALLREAAAAESDLLTGLLNRRGFNKHLEAEHLRCQRYQSPFTLVYLDVDNFKQVNDTLGHHQGDRLLQSVATTLLNQVRQTDFVGRLGGDEFAILMPETQAEDARIALEHGMAKLRQQIQAQAWPVSFSVGMVSFVKPPPTYSEALGMADQLMYRIKKSGKDGITCMEWGADPSDHNKVEGQA